MTHSRTAAALIYGIDQLTFCWYDIDQHCMQVQNNVFCTEVSATTVTVCFLFIWLLIDEYICLVNVV